MDMTAHKSAPILSIKAIDEEAGTIEGYASTFGGEPDAYGDVIAAGAYADTLADHAAKGTSPKMFWQHDSHEPIGRWTELSEDDRGLMVKGKLNLEVRRGAEALALLKAGDIDGLSIGYRIKAYSVDTETGVWTLEKLDLVEISVVSTPANENATIAGFSNAQAERAARVHLKGQGDLADDADERWSRFTRALMG